MEKSRCSLMKKVPLAGEEHGDACFVCCFYDFFVSDGATRLHDRRAAGFDGSLEAIFELSLIHI